VKWPLELLRLHLAKEVASMKLTLDLSPYRLLAALIFFAAALVALDAVMQITTLVGGIAIPDGISRLVDLDQEESIGNWYSTMLLMLGAIFGFVIAFAHRISGKPYMIHWLGLGAAFMWLSLDEAIGIHEGTIEPVRNALGTSGVLYYAWIIPAFVCVAAFGLLYLRFLGRLPGMFALLLIISGAVYVGSAGGLEMAEAPAMIRFGPDSFDARALPLFQEALEMVGAALYAFTLCLYMRRELNLGSITIGTPDAITTEASTQNDLSASPLPRRDMRLSRSPQT
jgi:hypothetical protein